jgi:hypothetical protein
VAAKALRLQIRVANRAKREAEWRLRFAYVEALKRYIGEAADELFRS